MKIPITIVFLIAQANAMSWAELFSPVEDSLGRLVSDVVTDIRDTIDCTILAVERALSLDGLFGTSSGYEEKCGGQSADPPTQTSDTSWSDSQPQEESYTQPENTETKKQLSAEIDVSLSGAGDKIQSVIDQSTAKEKIENVKESLKNESDRLSKISAVLKKEVDKIPEEVKKKFKFDNDHISVDNVVEEVKLLFETEQIDKGSAAANEVRRVFYEVLTMLNVTDVDPPLSDEEEVKLILTNIYQHSNNSLVDVEKQVSMWTKEVNRQITNIKNVVINVSQDGSSSTNNSNENFNRKDDTNKILYGKDNHNNKTTTSQAIAAESRVAINSKTDVIPETKDPKSKSIQIKDRNMTSVSHTVTAITIHKNNKTSVEVVHNKSLFSSTSKQLPNNSEIASIPSMIEHNGITDTVISKLLSKALNATSAQTTDTQSDSPKTKSSAVMSLDKTNTHTNNTSSPVFTDRGIGSSSAQKSHMSLQNNDTQLIVSGVSLTLPTTQIENVSTTELSKSDDQAKVMILPSPSKIAETGASKSDTKPDSPETKLHTMSQPDQDNSTEPLPEESAENSTPAAPTGPTIKSPKSKQYPKNFRDLSQQILGNSKSDQFNDYESSASGKFDMHVLEQLFGSPDKVEQQEAVQNAKSIIESSQHSEDYINKFFNRVDSKSAPSVFDDPDYFDS